MYVILKKAALLSRNFVTNVCLPFNAFASQHTDLLSAKSRERHGEMAPSCIRRVAIHLDQESKDTLPLFVVTSHKQRKSRGQIAPITNEKKRIRSIVEMVVVRLG